MNRPSTPPKQACPQNRTACNLQCKYNRFEAGELEIHAWELKCLDCGYRETIAFRNDDENLDWTSGQQRICPFCQKPDAQPGINPCG